MLKKALMSFLGITLSFMVYAGGTDYIPYKKDKDHEKHEEKHEEEHDHGIYLEGDLGYASVPWKKDFVVFSPDVPSIDPIKVMFVHNGSGEFTEGVSAGYQFNHHLSVELGAHELPTAEFLLVFPDGTIDQKGSTIQSWLFYAALKGMVEFPAIKHLDLFVKAGAAHRNTKVNFSQLGTYNADALSFLTALGLEYHVSSAFSIHAQWIHVSGQTIPSSFAVTVIPVPHVDLLLAGIGIHFAA